MNNPGSRFFLWMTVVMAVFVFGGFGMTYWYPMAHGTFQPAPPVVHLHGLVHFSWILLLVTQALLINRGNATLHRSLGTFGIALAVAVLFMGAIIQLLGGAASREHPSANYNHGMYLGIMAVFGFGLQFTLAMRNTRRPEVHKRAILLANLPLLPPGIHRFYMVPLGLKAFPVLPMYLTLDALAAAIIIQEWRTTSRVGTITLVGAGWILMQQALHYPVTHSAWFAEFLYWLTGLVHYR